MDLIDALSALTLPQRAELTEITDELAQRPALEVELLPLAAVWAAVAELSRDVTAAAEDVSGALLGLLSDTLVAAAVRRCTPDLRRILAVTLARERDHHVVDVDQAGAAVWAALAVLVADLDDAERAAARAAEQAFVDVLVTAEVSFDGDA